MKKKPTIEDLLKRIEELEKRPIVYPIYPPVQYIPSPHSVNPNLHYHGNIPCYQNPCAWC